MAGNQPTVFVIDNDAAQRDSLRWLLASTPLGFEEFETAERFLEVYTPDRPGCLVLDLRLPGMSGIQLQEVLQARRVRLPLIVTTGYADVGTAVAMLKRGALDFFEKPYAGEQLLDRVHQAVTLDARLRRERLVREALDARLACLTSRERAVFREVVHGKANKVMAIELGISEKTVEAHRARVMQKLGASSLADLVRLDVMVTRHDLFAAQLPAAEAWLART